jgi:hypothetical protein
VPFTLIPHQTDREALEKGSIHLIESPRLLSPEVIDKVSYSISLGCSLTTAASYAGISIATLRRWLLEYRQGNSNPDIKKLGESVEKARALFEQNAVEKVRELAQSKEDWKGFSYLLDRRAKAFGHRSEAEIARRLEEQAEDFIDVCREILPAETLEKIANSLATYED